MQLLGRERAGGGYKTGFSDENKFCFALKLREGEGGRDGEDWNGHVLS
jgi:hypothetical protein